MDELIIRKTVVTNEEKAQMREEALSATDRAHLREQEMERLVAEGKMERIVTYIKGAKCVKYRKV